MIALSQSLAAALAAALLALTFVFGREIHPLKSIVRDRRTLVSFGSGIAAAYLFVGIMPELAEGMANLERLGALHGQGGILVYVMALVGFVIFYGLDHATRPPVKQDGLKDVGISEKRILGYGAYVSLLTYVMAVEAGESAQATLWYAIAMSWHFLTIDHSLSESRGEKYDRRGRFLLAFCVVLGWAAAQVFVLSANITILALGFMSGALTVNSVIMELSERHDGRFVAFALGSFLYAALLLGVGMLS